MGFCRVSWHSEIIILIIHRTVLHACTWDYFENDLFSIYKEIFFALLKSEEKRIFLRLSFTFDLVWYDLGTVILNLESFRIKPSAFGTVLLSDNFWSSELWGQSPTRTGEQRAGTTLAFLEVMFDLHCSGSEGSSSSCFWGRRMFCHSGLLAPGGAVFYQGLIED